MRWVQRALSLSRPQRFGAAYESPCTKAQQLLRPARIGLLCEEAVQTYRECCAGVNEEHNRCSSAIWEDWPSRISGCCIPPRRPERPVKASSPLDKVSIYSTTPGTPSTLTLGGQNPDCTGCSASAPESASPRRTGPPQRPLKPICSLDWLNGGVLKCCQDPRPICTTSSLAMLMWMTIRYPGRSTVGLVS